MFKKNTAVTGFQIGHFIQTADGAAKTTGTPACKRLLDGTPGTLTNAASYDSTAGVWKIDLAAGDTNGDMVGLSFTLADCLPIGYTLRTTTKLVSDLNDAAGGDTAGTTTLLTRVVGTLATGTHNPQSGDAYARLTGTVEPAVADLPTNSELATALGTADDATLAAIAALNNLSSAQAQSAATAALNAYDPPTNAEMEARTLVAANYFDPAADVVAHVTLVDTTTTLTNMPAAAPSAADIKTALEVDGSKLDHLWEMTADDGGVRQLTAHALELAPAGGGTGLTAQETADAVNNLAPTGASGAAGSIRAQLVNTAKTGADSDTLKTLSDQIDDVQAGNSDALKTLSDQIDGVQAGSGLTAQETANAVHNLAPVGVAAVGSIGANLDSILNGLTGVGLIPLVYTVTEPGGVIPISGVTVELYTEEACLNCVRRGLTNSFGVVTFWMSTAGTYWIKSAKDRYSFELDSETVAV